MKTQCLNTLFMDAVGLSPLAQTSAPPADLCKPIPTASNASPHPHHSRLDNVNAWIGLGREAHYSVTSLANRLQISRRQLDRFFLTQYGLHPKAWLLQLRLSDAALLLRQGLPIKAVAYELGYKDLGHFYRDFRNSYRQTPLCYQLLCSHPRNSGNVPIRI